MATPLRQQPISLSTLLFPPTFSPQQPSLSFHKKQPKTPKMVVLSSSYEVGGGYSQEELDIQDRNRKEKNKDNNQKKDSPYYEALLNGGEQVTSVLEEMAKLVSSLLNYSCSFFITVIQLLGIENLIFFKLWV